ncbi:MAG: hypothetical protein L0207_05935 [Chlamydiae bacterium]|nr:hypothetical protein [Chlamydiota bacterium]
MKKRFIGYITAFCLTGSSLCFSQEGESEIKAGKCVGKGCADSARMANSSLLHNWALAGIVIAIGITALVLVAHHHR